MADLTQCDGCGKISPNEHGLHTANRWLEVTIKKRAIDSWPQSYIFCRACMGMVERSTPAKTCFGLIREKLLWFFAGTRTPIESED